MAIQNLTQRAGRFLGWEFSESLAAGATSDPVVIPPLLAGQRISVRTIGGAQDAKVQSTISSDAKVTAGTAVWEDWPPGMQVGTVSANLDAPVTGIRCTVGTATAGEILWEILV